MYQTAIILTQGSELLSGFIDNLNAQFLCAQLHDKGISVLAHHCLRDDQTEIATALQESCRKADLVICSGGLGPTQDDCTREACAQAFGLSLTEHSTAKEHLISYYKKRNRTPLENTRKMAYIPKDARYIPNPMGSASCFQLQVHSATLFCFPGVPTELKALFTQEIIPLLSQSKPMISFGCFDIRESQLENMLSSYPFPIGYRATRRGIQLKIYPSQEDILRVTQEIKQRLKKYIFSTGHCDLAKSVGELLAHRKETLALAESCTAGTVSSWITSIPGASRYFLEGVVVYSNESKIRRCLVPSSEIEENGAVSEEVARSMASGIKKTAHSTWGLAITGISGPGGGTQYKPVGTVHIALSGPHETKHRKLQLHGTRAQIVNSSAAYALFLLFTQIRG